MLTLGEIIRADKLHVRIGPWRTGPVPASAFPIAKQKRLSSGPAWSWRVIEFDAIGRSFRLLLRLNAGIEKYSSILGLADGTLNRIICHHELHTAHRNWHCHFTTGNVETVMPGVLRDKERMRVYEHAPSVADDVAFDVDATNALAIAAKRFRFTAPDETPAQARLL